MHALHSLVQYRLILGLGMKYTQNAHPHTQNIVTNAMSTVFTTLDYGYKHKNKGIGLVMVTRKCEVYT